jgi:hypothetical protein
LSSDGRLIAYYRTDPKSQLDIWTLSLDPDRRVGGAGRADSPDTLKPVPFLNTEFNESQAQFSPDGRWMAYVSDESGIQQVYAQSFPGLGGERQISTEGGTQPRWRRDGKELFYLAEDGTLMSIEVRGGTGFKASDPRPLFKTRVPRTDFPNFHSFYDVTADGQRFLVVSEPEVRTSPPITVVLDWAAGLAVPSR